MSTKAEDKCHFGPRIAEEMQHTGFTQKQFATRIAVSDRTLRSWLSENTAPNLRDLHMMEGAGCDAWYIYSGEKLPPSGSEHAEPTAAERAGAYVASLNLSEDDAKLLRDMAKRLAT